MRGYWRDVGTVDAYWASHQDLLGEEPPIALDDQAWPIRTRSPRSTGSLVLNGAEIEESLLGPGSRVAGRVSRSVIGSAVVVEAGAVVEDSVIMHRTVVRAGAHVVRAVVDEGVDIGPDAVVGAAGGDITLVGRGASIARASS
jgi:glucose-1-phosphate adenylyltransferase